MTFLASLVLAASFDGEAARVHASRLAALGPHPWGSPRAAAAAQYVEAQFGAVGLQRVRNQDFETGGIHGSNVIGVLPGPGKEIILLGAHHDTAPQAPGAYDDGGGVAVLIEAARVLAALPGRNRTLVFVSFDGEESWSTRAGTTAGSRAYLRSLGVDARNIVATFVVEMCGWKEGAPNVQPIAYADPLRRGRYVITPGWLVQAVLDGSKQGGGRFVVGDPLVSWLYQPAVRTFRVGLYGDDLSFLQAGRPATFVSDSSFSRYYPHYHRPDDTADKLDGPSLARMGRRVVGVIRTLAETRGGTSRDLHWFAAFGHVFAGWTLYFVGALGAVVSVRPAMRSRGVALAAALFAAAGFGYLLWRNPVPVLWIFLLPLVVGSFSGRSLWLVLSFLPGLALAALGALAWRRGFVSGIWFETWEVALLWLVVAALFVRGRGEGGRKRKKGGRRRGLKERS